MNRATVNSRLERILDTAAMLAPKASAHPSSVPTQNSDYVHRRGALVVPAPNNLNQLVVSYRVPEAFEAVLTHLVFLFTGTTGPDPGDATQLYYSLRVNGSYMARDFAQVATSLGSLEIPYPVPGGMLLSAGTLIEGLVSVPNASPISTGAGNYAHIHLLGWQWPINQ